MGSASSGKQAAEWAKLDAGNRREFLQAVEELGKPERLKAELREEFERLYKGAKREAGLQIRENWKEEEAEEEFRREKKRSLITIGITISAGAALVLSGLLPSGWLQVACCESAVPVFYAAWLAVRYHRRDFGSPKLPIRKAPY